MLIWFLPVFLMFLLLGLPVMFALLSAPGLLLWLNGQERDITLLYRNVYNGIDSFPLMAIPFFMLAGELMNRSRITERLVEFAQAMMGHLRGGLAHVNILSSMLFAGLSGSAVADTSALGSMLIPAMEKQGYSRRFSAAITAASSVIGPIIPPSGIMIIYAYVMGESGAALTSAVVLLLVGAAMAFKTVVSLSHAPEILAALILSISENPLILLFLINMLLFVVGMFLDAGPAIIILGPILGPIFVSMGIDPVHFAIIMSVNLTVGLATPPMGLVLFVASSVSGERIENIARAILPFLAVEIATIFLITYVPAISMTIPRLTGFVD